MKGLFEISAISQCGEGEGCQHGISGPWVWIGPKSITLTAEDTTLHAAVRLYKRVAQYMMMDRPLSPLTSITPLFSASCPALSTRLQ